MTSNIYVVKSVNTVDLKSIGSALRVQVPPWISKRNPEAASVPPLAKPGEVRRWEYQGSLGSSRKEAKVSYQNSSSNQRFSAPDPPQGNFNFDYKCTAFGIGDSLKSKVLILVFDSLVGKAAHC